VVVELVMEQAAEEQELHSQVDQAVAELLVQVMQADQEQLIKVTLVVVLQQEHIAQQLQVVVVLEQQVQVEVQLLILVVMVVMVLLLVLVAHL
jgi:hypothetical protein